MRKNPFEQGNDYLIFHYTKFESAVKILASRSLRMGNMHSLNDISENSKQILASDDERAQIARKIFKQYHSLSFTLDWVRDKRGFDLAPLWGYYAESGHGVCIAFNKKTIELAFKKKYNNNCQVGPIYYIYDNPRNNILWDAELASGRFSEDALEDLYYLKNEEWRYEREFRFLAYSDKDTPDFSFPAGAIEGVVLNYSGVYNPLTLFERAECKAIIKLIGKEKLFILADDHLVDIRNEQIYPSKCNVIGIIGDIIWQYPFVEGNEEEDLQKYSFHSDGTIQHWRAEGRNSCLYATIIKAKDIPLSRTEAILMCCPQEVRELLTSNT